MIRARENTKNIASMPTSALEREQCAGNVIFSPKLTTLWEQAPEGL